MDNMLVTVIVSLVSSGASFVMGGVWWLIETQKKQAKQLNIAFSKIRDLESINATYLDENAVQADDGNLCRKDGDLHVPGDIR